METKVCKKCGVEKPATKEFWHVNKGGIYGLCSKCKKCRLLIRKEYVDKNKDKCNESSIKYRNKNRELCLSRSSEWRLKNKDKCKIYQAKWRKDNKTKIEIYNKKNRVRFSERIKIAKKKDYIKHRERYREINKKNAEFLPDSYVIYALIARGFNKEFITPELIEVKRLLIKTKRLCKTSQN